VGLVVPYLHRVEKGAVRRRREHDGFDRAGRAERRGDGSLPRRTGLDEALPQVAAIAVAVALADLLAL
jgi:hypothetical protein